MKLKRFGQLFEYQEEESDEEKLASEYGVSEFKINGIIKIDENEVVFTGRNWAGILSELTINFNDKSIKVVSEDEY